MALRAVAAKTVLAFDSTGIHMYEIVVPNECFKSKFIYNF
jgi:hypothetical protein